MSDDESCKLVELHRADSARYTGADIEGQRVRMEVQVDKVVLADCHHLVTCDP